MATLFYWANFIISFGLVVMTFRRYRSTGIPFVHHFTHPWTWQFIACVLVALSGLRPWNLLWMLVVSLALSFWLDMKVMSPSLEWIPRCLPLDDQKPFEEFVRSQPALRSKLLNLSYDEPSQLHFQYDVALILCSFSGLCLEERNHLASLTALEFAMRFDRHSPLVWYNLAEVRIAISDRCAARWAAKVVDWKPTTGVPLTRSAQLYATPEGKTLLRQTKARMKQIIAICSENPTWTDSATWLVPFGLDDEE